MINDTKTAKHQIRQALTGVSEQKRNKAVKKSKNINKNWKQFTVAAR